MKPSTALSGGCTPVRLPAVDRTSFFLCFFLLDKTLCPRQGLQGRVSTAMTWHGAVIPYFMFHHQMVSQ